MRARRRAGPTAIQTSTAAEAVGTATPVTNAGAGAEAKFTANAHLVVEDVRVKDKDGKPIQGLKAEDFTITEDANPQTIAFCEYQDLPDAPADAPATPLLRRDSEVAAVTSTQIQPEAPGDLRYKDRRLLAIYFDMSAMPQADQLRALDAAAKFVKKQMAAPDLVAIIGQKLVLTAIGQAQTADDGQKLVPVEIEQEGLVRFQ